ncbi:hypothetical protein CR513_19579, partial [Mucuna pruriens]
MSPLIAYLRDETLPKDIVEAKRIIKDATRYIIIGGELYRRGFSFPLPRCIEGEEARYGDRALASKIARTSYYWPTLKGDCMDYVKRCNKCQRFVEVGNAPLEQLHSITSLWPFDICIRILVDHELLYQVEDKATIHVSQTPQTNEQAEVANKVILRGLCRRLKEAKGRWVEELPQVLWFYHTTPHSSTNKTPFRLTFSIEAVIPVEIREPSPRTVLFRPVENEDEISVNLDLLQEACEVAQVKEYAAKARAATRQR